MCDELRSTPALFGLMKPFMFRQAQHERLHISFVLH